MRINIYKRACGPIEEDSIRIPGDLREEILALSAKEKAKAKASVERAGNTGRASFPFP